MNSLQARIHRALGWAIQRNPAYLVSAALTAVGARLFLVGPADPAGDIRLILLTFGVLQVYEWAVEGILIALHRAGRSPEDQPSLLLVATVFWTGPMAATMEMIAYRPRLGTYLAAGACMIALGELRTCCRMLGLRLTRAAQAIGAACMILLAGAAPLLKMPDSNSGANELYLYAAWWVFAAVVLLGITAVRASRRRAGGQGPSESSWRRGQDLPFLATTITATAVHLVGMNYGFFCHAVPFYASPLLVALSIVGFEILVGRLRHPGWLTAAVFTLPAVAILLAVRPFDEHVPVERLPAWVRDPLLSMSVFAALAWWWGYLRHRRILFLHAGNAACAFAAFQMVRGPVIELHQFDSRIVLCLLYGAAGYFAILALLQRSRIEALVALGVNLAATVLLVRGKTPVDVLLIWLVAGWSAFVGVHLTARRPRLWTRLAPIVVLMIIPWTLDSAAPYQRLLAAHSVAVILLLFAIGHHWRWTRYRPAALVLASGHILVLAVLLMLKGSHPAATALVSAGFALLAGGALISWHKGRLLKMIPAAEADAHAQPGGGEMRGA